MKKLVIGLTLLTSMSSFAEVLNVVSLSETKQNVDGTTTILKPLVVRGQNNYIISKDTSMLGVCRSAGFDHYLEDSAYINFNGENYSTDTIFVDDSGEFIKKERSNNRNTLTEITCYNGIYSTTINSPEEHIVNEDGTTTILKPLVVRGQNKYIISKNTSLLGVCRSAGFDQYLEDSAYTNFDGFNYSTNTIFVDDNGDFVKKDRSNNRKTLTEITCYFGEE